MNLNLYNCYIFSGNYNRPLQPSITFFLNNEEIAPIKYQVWILILMTFLLIYKFKLKIKINLELVVYSIIMYIYINS